LAHTDDAVADPQREAIVGSPGGEDLAVIGFVGEEGDLREQDAEGRGDEQLEPAVAEEDEAGDRSAEAERDGSADEGVEDGGAGEEPALANDLRQLRVGLGDRGELGGAGIGLTNGAETGLDDGGGDEDAPRDDDRSREPRRLPGLRPTLRGSP
jgi:hypothetical protein